MLLAFSTSAGVYTAIALASPLAGTVKLAAESVAGGTMALVDLVMMPPLNAVNARRFHDTGRSGVALGAAVVNATVAVLHKSKRPLEWVAAFLIAVVLVVSALRGPPGSNAYGCAPAD